MIYISDSAKIVQGIRLDGGAENRTIYAYHNTVVLAGGATDESYSLYFTGNDGTFRVKNNIFINYRTHETLLNQNAVFIGYVTATAPTFDLANNIYYCSINNGFKARYKTQIIENLEIWRDSGNFDARSKVMNINFQDLGNYNLHLDSLYAGLMSLVGDILGVTHDFDNENRGTIPYIGADELAFSQYPFYNVQVTPSQLDFGEVALGFSNTQTITLINNEGNVIGFDSIVAPQGWKLSVDNEPFGSVLNSIYLPGNSTKTVNIKFEPNIMGPHSGDVVVYIGVQQFKINVTAIAISADLAISATEINVGSTPIHVPMEYHNFKVYNISDTSQLITISVTGEFYLRFADSTAWFTSSSNVEIPSGDSCEFVIKFEPHSYNFHNDSIVVSNQNYSFYCKLIGRALGVKFNNISQNSFFKIYNGASAWGDYDGDGLQDVVITGYSIAPYKGYLHVYKNVSNGNFLKINQNFTGVGNSAVDWIDIDNDNDLDIIAFGQDTMNVRKFFIIENVNGTFIERQSANIPGIYEGSISVADFNRDGYQDILITGEEYVANADDIVRTGIYLNNKNKDFVYFPTNLPLVSSGYAAAGDFNNDGLIDVAITGRVSSFNFITKVYINQGTSEFAPIDLPGAMGLRYSKVRWGDYNNDGFLDLLITGSFDNQQNSVTYVYENTGEDSFILTHQLPGVRQGDIQWADFDNNGNLDIVMNGIYNDAVWLGRIYIYKSDTKNYQLVDTIVEMRATNISLCDFNSDGKIDFLLTGRYDYQDYRCNLYENQWHISNDPPQAPNEISVNFTGSLLVLNWTPGSDDKSSVTYNLRIGTQPGLGDIFNSYNSYGSVMSAPAWGNMAFNRLILLPWNHNGTFYASVQSIDASFQASPWRVSSAFTALTETGQIPVSIYPAKDFVTISGVHALGQKATFELYEITGSLIYKHELNSSADNIVTLDLQSLNLSKGIYIVRLAGYQANYSFPISLQ